MSKGVVMNKNKDNNSLTPSSGETQSYTPQYRTLLKEGVIAGIGWAFGVTIGFVLVSTILVVAFKNLGGVPIIGDALADVIESTQEQLLKRSIIIPTGDL